MFLSELLGQDLRLVPLEDRDALHGVGAEVDVHVEEWLFGPIG